ncbi:MAG: alkaline phosphatase family protein [Planctomycetota bacterium]|jgi:predicted AlkP superfamily pyrophosphatase or phosphodiesterase
MRDAIRTAVTFLLAAATCRGTVTAAAPPPIDHVIVISVDGLRSDALLAPPPGALPAFDRLRLGRSTLNARTLVDSTVTLPNHVGMVTGRLLSGEHGHRWSVNEVKRGYTSVHEIAGTRIDSVFDVAAAHGVFTGAVVTKTKLRLLPFSWDSIDEFIDLTPAHASVRERTEAVTEEVRQLLRRGHERSLLFVHFAEPDSAGHTSGWDLTPGSPYLDAVESVDRQLGRILRAIESDERLRGRTAIVVTADHGGGSPLRHHSRTEFWINYVVPFLVWTGNDLAAGELYDLLPFSRRDPGLAQPRAHRGPPPVRNADVANAALGLLGLPPVPGSTANVDQDVR